MPKSAEGLKIPEIRFKLRKDGAWAELSSAELFDAQKVVLFGLPGAFTPTCSSAHLPRFEELAPSFQQHGIDRIVCVSVNDAFVMEAWAREQRIEQVLMLPDGNGELSAALGMLVDKSELGFGQRSWRYSALVENGVVSKMFVEPEVEGDPFTVSDADTMLSHIAPGAAKPLFFTFFSRLGCPHCARARQALESRGYAYEELVLGRDASVRAMRAVSGGQTTPQVFLEGRRIGTADELEAFLQGL
ncbi:MAG: glutathione peroxidase [Myxococcota bacterium]|nr:glutathione peroxidase [Myxococcota bacterium]